MRSAGPIVALILFVLIGVLALYFALNSDVECEAYTSSGECVIWAPKDDGE